MLTPDGKALETLELQDAQEGFAGISGEILTIEPDGTWRIVRFLNDRVEEPHRMGRLHPKGTQGVGRGILAEEDFSELPSVVGELPEADAHRVTVRFGETSSTRRRSQARTYPKLRRCRAAAYRAADKIGHDRGEDPQNYPASTVLMAAEQAGIVAKVLGSTVSAGADR